MLPPDIKLVASTAVEGKEALALARAAEKSPAARKTRREQDRLDQLHRVAAAVPLPGPAAAAAIPERAAVFGRLLAPITARHISVLQACANPVYTQILGAGLIARARKKSEKNLIAKALALKTPTIDDTAEALYIFTHERPEELAAILQQKDGRARLRTTALHSILDDKNFPPIADWRAVTEVMAVHYAACFATRIAFHCRPIEDSGGGVPPPDPSRPASAPATASAGSSN